MDGNKKEDWDDRWSDAFMAHRLPIADAIRANDPRKIRQAMDVHLPQLIAIRDKVVALPMPHSFQRGLFETVRNVIFGLKKRDVFDAERQGLLDVWNRAIKDFQRELRRLDTGCR